MTLLGCDDDPDLRGLMSNRIEAAGIWIFTSVLLIIESYILSRVHLNSSSAYHFLRTLVDNDTLQIVEPRF